MAEPLTLGTAGHIDHGKTALVAALTGVDTDRLPEERRRGISIALRYARLDLPSGRSLSVLDLLDIGPCRHSWPLPKALAAIQASPRGAAVLLNCGEDVVGLLAQFAADPAERDRAPRGNAQMDLRTYGVGAQILRELGVCRMKLLGSPRRMPSMTGYGLEVVGYLAPALGASHPASS